MGADGVMIAGCHPGECHYLEQNYKALRRFSMLQHTLSTLGMEEGRMRLQWASAAEGGVLAEAINEMVEDVRALGPLNWPSNWEQDEEVEAAVERLAEEHAQAMEVPA
jgi:F420-non-reducing hydrogenase iron-sulfur subunit